MAYYAKLTYFGIDAYQVAVLRVCAVRAITPGLASYADQGGRPAMKGPMVSRAAEWFVRLSEKLRRSVDAASSGVIRLDLGELAAVWVCSRSEAEWLLCKAALHVGLAVGVVDRVFCDVMTVEQACTVLDESGFEYCESLMH